MVIDLLKKVTHLNEYISITQDVARSTERKKLQFNMSTVLCLKKIRALEIEYFNKCEGNGVALLLFEEIVELPPSKTWEFLGKELVSLLQYWLDAMRKHLIKHNQNWWSFLKELLNLIKLIRLKHQSLPNILVECTAECLFDLATAPEPDVLQRLEILYCLNLCCADASRDKRNLLKDKFEYFFTKLSGRLASCSHLPTQFSILETLLRWLLPRHDPSVRQAAAVKWFPEKTFGWKAVQLFLERPWQYFFQDARDFLNVFNERANVVVSVLCRRMIIGSVLVVTGPEKRETWLDVNPGDNSISVLLDPRVLDSIGIPADSWDTLIISQENIQHIELSRDAAEVTLSVQTAQAPSLLSSGTKIGDGCRIKAVIGTKGVERLDKTLRDRFSSLYKTLLDLDKLSYSMSPVEKIENKALITEEDTRFSHPAEAKKRKRSGYVVKSKHPPWKSPSTASTSSLAHLHEKLSQLPRYNFDKEAAQVCALPDLSTVTEVSETDDRQSVFNASTIKITRPYGVCTKNNTKNSQSDSEVQGKPKFGRYLSPAARECENSISCLLVATVGSDESVINDTLERITKNKDFHGDNIVDLLVQEALQNEKDKLEDSGINTDVSKKTQEPNQITTETAEEYKPSIAGFPERIISKDGHKACTVISNTTTDESNDVVYDTPLNFVNVRRRQRVVEKEAIQENSNVPPVFDVDAVENFFSEHLSENNRGEIVISPTLARKINETSSESEQFDLCEQLSNCITNVDNVQVDQIEINDLEVIECLNNIVDLVCNDLDKCTDMLDKDSIDIISVVDKETHPVILRDTSNIKKSFGNNQENCSSNDSKPTRSVKLRCYKRVPKTRANSKKAKSKLDLKAVSNMSPIMEAADAIDEKVTETVTTPESKKGSSTSKTDSLDMPLIRRKRKLYSPKDEKDSNRNYHNDTSDIEENNEFKTSKTFNYTATSYKDIEEDRAKRIRQPRSRRSRNKYDRTPSPHTKKMNDMFDNLKGRFESNESVTLADKKKKDMAVFNLTSDSEDEDFKKKTLEIRKRISTDSSRSLRRGRTADRVNYSENKSSDETVPKKVTRPKRNTKRKKQTKTKLVAKESDLIDEKMRTQTNEDPINTSLVLEEPIKILDEVPKLSLKERPQLEPISDKPLKDSNKNDKKGKKNKKNTLTSRTDKNNITDIDINSNRNESPLPGLVVEAMPVNIDDGNDSISVNMLQKFKKFYEDGVESCYNETNTTHNLLSDIDKTNYSIPRGYTTEELNRIDNYEDLDTGRGIGKNIEAKSKNISQTKTDNSVIVLEETIKIEQEKFAKNSTYNKRVSVEAIEILEISGNQSEKSIITVGKSPITAHGDSNEEPPDSQLLTEKLKPRDLNVEYLDQSIKDYYKKLTKEIDGLSHFRDSKDSGNTPVRSKSSKSPLVSIARLSIDDISKFLPSRRNSDTDSGSFVQKSETKQNSSTNENVKASQSKNSSKDTNLKSDFDATDVPKENLQRRKSERLVGKPLKTYSEDSDSENVFKPSEEVFECKQVRRSGKILQSSESEDDDLKVTKYLGTGRWIDRKLDKVNKGERRIDTQSTFDSTKKENPTSKNRKSIISPIRMFGEIYPNSTLETATKDDSNTKDYKVKTYVLNKHYILSSPESIVSTSTRILETEKAKSKRKSSSPERVVTKKRKSQEQLALSESGPSVSSVNDWFRRNAPTNRDQTMNTTATFTETIHHIMEKLDTTLEEIHQNTTRNFIHMFVDVQKELAVKRQERREMYKSVASEILGEVVKLIDSKFANLDERSQERDEEFIGHLKRDAARLIREDCQKKKLMIGILKEDVQAVLEHLGERKS